MTRTIDGRELELTAEQAAAWDRWEAARKAMDAIGRPPNPSAELKVEYERLIDVRRAAYYEFIALCS